MEEQFNTNIVFFRQKSNFGQAVGNWRKMRLFLVRVSSHSFNIYLWTGFQRDCVPLAESRGSASGRVRGSAPNTTGASQRVNPKTVRWNVFWEGDSLQCREMSEGQRVPDTISVALQEKAFPWMGRRGRRPLQKGKDIFSPWVLQIVRRCGIIRYAVERLLSL